MDIKQSHLEALARDIGVKCKQDIKNVIFELKDLKNDSLKIFLKYIRSTNINYAGNQDQIASVFEFQIRGKRSSVQFLAQLINLELNMRKNLTIYSEEQRTYNFENVTEIDLSDINIRYYLEENEENPEVNDTENNILEYQKNYTLNVLFKLK